MVAQAIDYRRHVRRPVGFVVFGLVLMIAAAYLFYDVLARRSQAQPVATTYTYTVDQSVDKAVVYFPSSFYDGGPGTNTAYIMGLTDKLKTTFHYSFSASEVQDLAYAYDIRATVDGVFSLDGNEGNTANVWTKSFQLLKPVHGTSTSKELTFSPSVDVPYSDYTKMIDELRTSLVLPISSKVTVLFTVNVSGVVGGKTFNDMRTASVTAPIGMQIYTLSQKYDKQDTKQVVTAAAQTGNDRRDQYENYGAIALGLLATASFIYGFRRQIFKTPYQRELDKIYRYHEGIIVRASRQTDMTGKHVVVVKSFDDMLNLEEELKLPIVATALNAEATRFTIIRDDVVYAYTLGRTPVTTHGRSLEEISDTVTTHGVFRKAPTSQQKKIQ